MVTKPKIEFRPEQAYAAIRLQVPIPFGQLVPGHLEETAGWLASHGLNPAGASFIRYLTTDMTRKLDIEIGWPTAAAIAGDERVFTGVFPAGQYAVSMYTGPFEGNGLVNATAALLDWAEKNHITWAKSNLNGVEWWQARLEHYLTDPAEEPDPQKWQTELAFLTAN